MKTFKEFLKEDSNYEAGVKACKEGKSINDNPYRFNPIEQEKQLDQWEKGFKDCRDDNLKEEPKWPAGAGWFGTDKLTDTYRNDTPGQELANIGKKGKNSFKTFAEMKEFIEKKRNE